MAKARELPSQEYLNALFDYNAGTGLLFRNHLSIDEMADQWGWSQKRVKKWNTLYSGTPAMNSSQCGYMRQMLDGKQHLVHRIIYKIMTGDDPDFIDHENGQRSDNRWANLRNVSCGENSQNQKMYSHNKSGHTGVYWQRSASKWRAYIMVAGKNTHLGMFSEIGDAIAARKAAETLYGFHPNHGQR